MEQVLPNLSTALDRIIASLPGLMPEFTLTAAFVLSIFSGLFLDRIWRHTTMTITILGITLSGVFISLQLADPVAGPLLFGMALPDRFSIYIRLLIAAVALLFVLFVHSNRDFQSHQKKTSDLYTVLFAVMIGLNLMVMSSNWLMVYLAIEMVSIGSYIMVGYLSKESKQAEAALKYVLFGSACSAVMLYGLSLLYGFTGNLDFTSTQHLAGLAGTNSFLVVVALVMVFTGIGFKLSFVPFHFWSPDVYQGAPTPVTAFLSTAPKIAAIALLTKILQAWPPSLGEYAQSLHFMVVLATIATLLFGNLAALGQTNIKRLMAYSSIGHTGFLMMASLAYAQQDFAVLLFYLSIYAAMNMGVFMLVDEIESRSGALELGDYKGIGKAMPLTLVGFVVLLVSLTGLPPTAGFVGKLLIFSAAFGNWQGTGDTGMLALLVVGALTTVISLFFYFKVPLNAFLRSPEKPLVLTKSPSSTRLIIAVLLAAFVLVLGLYPDWLVGVFDFGG